MTDPSVPPDDFPYAPTISSVAGAAPKLPLRKEGDQYVEEQQEDAAARYMLCQDLADQIVAYCRRKQSDNSDYDLHALLAQVAVQVEAKSWVSPAELDWTIQQAAAQLCVPAPLTSRSALLSLRRALLLPCGPAIETRVTAVLKRLAQRCS